MTRKMKDSGVEWIGEIPKDWEMVRLKDKYIFEKGKNAGLYTKEYVGSNIGNYPVYSGQTENKGVMGYIDSYEYDLKDSIYTTTVGAKVMTANMIFGKISLSQNCVLFINSDENTDDRFVLYFLNPLFKYEKSMIPSYMQPSLRIEDLKRYIMFTPNIDEQKSIANFLDEKTLEIDNIISKTKKAIKEYKKYKQSLITETVTKGLDKNIPMKDSGIKWMGEIPEHWDVIRPNRVCEIIRGNSSFQKTDLESEGDYIALQYGQTYKVDIVDDRYKYYVDKLFYKPDQIVENGDTILISTSETMEDLGHSCFYNRDDVALLGGEQMCLKANKEDILDKFLYYSTKYFNIELNQYATGLKVYRFRLDDLKKINMVLPPKNEQSIIINLLDEKLPLIDQIISTKEKLLTEMEAYKKSLIYETVTGKREVE